MKVLILGGTGAMGIHLVELLTQNGIDTFVTSRSHKKSENNLHYLRGNAKNLDFLGDVLNEHWDAIVDFMVYSTDEFKNKVNLLLNKTSQYVFLSSARVYANSNHLLKEDSPRLLDISEDKEYLETDEYALTKARQEDILKNSGKKNWTIIRPYITYSENRFQLGVLEKEEWLYRALKERTIVFSNDIFAKKTTMTYGLDVSRSIMAILGNLNALGNVFHITSNQFCSWEEILSHYLNIFEKTLGFKPKILLQNMNKFVKIHPAKYQIEYDRLYERQFNNSKINKFVNTKSFISIEKGLEKCLPEFLQNPKFKNINWKLEAIKDKQTKEKTPLNEIDGVKQKIKYLFFRYLPIQIISILKNYRK